MGDLAPIETRSVAVAAVRYPERIIDIIAVPWDQWATVEYHGRVIEEAFQRGAFGSAIARKARDFRVNYEHDDDRPAGRVHALHPSHADGLVAEIKVRRGPEGDQTLDDADDGMLRASIGFGALPENQRWETRTRRRIVKAFLDHIALTWQPAYAGAVPLGVRSGFTPSAVPVPDGGTPAPVPMASLTPNLDSIRLAELAARYGHTLNS